MLVGDNWVEIRAWRVAPTRNVPHGLRYSLTLHDAYGTRIVGYDNAHAHKKPKKFRYAGRKLPYGFRDAHQLLKDFFAEVDRVLKAWKET